MGKTEKKTGGKENHATKVTKIPKTKRRKYGMNKTNVSRSEQKNCETIFVLYVDCGCTALYICSYNDDVQLLHRY